jgi:uncharacterized protein (DUF58 family)
MYYPKPENGKIRFATLCAASLAYLLTSQRDAVGLTTFAEDIVYQSPVKSTKGHLDQLFKTLGDLQTQEGGNNTNVSEALHSVASKIHRRSLVILFTDMFQKTNDLDEIFNGLQHLRHGKHEILIFHVTDKKTEQDFEFEDRPHRFVDLETNAVLKLNPFEVKEAYQAQSKKLYEEIELRCGIQKIDLIEADISEPFDKVLGAYLIKRKRLK